MGDHVKGREQVSPTRNIFTGKKLQAPEIDPEFEFKLERRHRDSHEIDDLLV